MIASDEGRLYLYRSFALPLANAAQYIDYAQLEAKSKRNADLQTVYIAETVRIASNNIANAFGGTILEMTLADFVERVDKKPDRRNCEEIVNDIASKTGMKVVD